MTDASARSDDLAALRAQMKGFLRAATHELNTPLGVIQHMLLALETSYPDHPDAQVYIDGVRLEVGRLVSVVDDLGLRNELENGSIGLNLVPVAVDSLLPDLLSDVQAQHPERDPSADCPPDLPSVRADPDHLRFVLWTLMHNAARCSTVRLKDILLRIEPEPERRSVRFSVADDAPALAPDYADRIFEALPDIPVELHRPSYALGMGLYPARQLARRMGGDLWLEPAPGRNGAARSGNVFVLRLPAAEPADDAATIPAEGEGAAA